VENILTARTLAGNFCRKGEMHNMYYALKFDQSVQAFGTWVNNQAPQAGRTSVSSANNNQIGIYFTFPDGTEVIRARMAISYTSQAGALANLQAEIPDITSTTFDTVKQAAYDTWNQELSKVKVTDPVATQLPAADPTRDLKTFYTALYHSITHPATMNDVDGSYIGFESENEVRETQQEPASPIIHNSSEKPGACGRARTQYTMISDWDTYRCLVPFLAAIWPEVASDQAQSLINAAEQMGNYPNWMVANSSTTQMNGDDVAPLLAFTWEFGARDWDVEEGLAWLVEAAIGSDAGKFTGGTNTGWGFTNHMTNIRWPVVERAGADYYNKFHYAPQVRPFQADHQVTGGSFTLEYAIDDYSIAVIADALGATRFADALAANKDAWQAQGYSIAELSDLLAGTDVRATFTERAQWWQNLFNPTADGIQPRDINGNYPQTDPVEQYPRNFGYKGNTYDLGQQGFEEGNAEQYLWMVPHNLAGLADSLGGRAATIARLERFLSTGLVRGANANVPYMNLDNEPNFGVPWVFNYLGRPDRTTEVVDQITQTLFGYLPAGSEPGNDDLGALANLDVWAMLGLYPEMSGDSPLIWNAPAFERSQIELGNGHTLTINAPGAQDARHYETGKKYITAMTVNGVETTKSWIDFETFDRDTVVDITLEAEPGTWGTADADLPPSVREGGLGAAINVTPVNSRLFGFPTVAPGGTGAARLDLQLIEGDAGFEVAIEAADGLSVAAASAGTFNINGRASVPLTISADRFLASGWYDFTVTVTTGGLSSSYTETVRVAAPDSLEANKEIIGTGDYDALVGTFDSSNVNDGVAWGEANGTQMGDNTRTNVYDRAELARVGLAPGAVVDFEADGRQLQATWPSAPIGAPETYIPRSTTTQSLQIALDKPTSVISFLGAAINTGGTSTTVQLKVSDGESITYVPYTLALSNWVFPAGSGTAVTDPPMYGNTPVGGWMPHRLAVETATDPGAWVLATEPYVAPAGSKVVGVRFTANTDQRIFAIASERPTLVVDNTASAGSRIGVTGTGFAAGEPVTVQIGTTPPSTQVLTADAMGEISGTIRVSPATQAEGHFPVTVKAASTPADALPALRPVTVTEVRTYEPIATGPAEPIATGEDVPFAGGGFEPGESVTVTLGSETEIAVADAAGRVSGTIAAPKRSGQYTLTLSGAESLGAHSVPVTIVGVAPQPGPTVTVTAGAGDGGGAPGGPAGGPAIVLPASSGLSLSAASIAWGATVTASASFPGSTGAVEFYDGSTLLGQSDLADGVATITLPSLEVGGHAITALYLGNTTTASARTSGALVTVTKAAAAVSVKAVKHKAGAKVKVPVTVKVPGLTPVGKVKVLVNGKAVKTVKLGAAKKGKITVTLPKKYAKAIKVKATFTPTDAAHVTSKTSKAVKVGIKK
jgi:putative alpha-1,2-mannosidase